MDIVSGLIDNAALVVASGAGNLDSNVGTGTAGAHRRSGNLHDLRLRRIVPVRESYSLCMLVRASSTRTLSGTFKLIAQTSCGYVS